MAAKRFVFVVLCEHYHFPPNDSDMAGCPILGYFPGTAKGMLNAVNFVKDRLKRQLNPLNRPLNSYQDGERERRYWLECPKEDQITSRLVYVVRKVFLNPV